MMYSINKNKVCSFFSAGIVLLTFSVVSLASASTILIDPDYEDPRLSEVNKFHAGCNNIFQVALDSIDNVKDVKLYFQYNQDDIDIVRFIPDRSSAKEHIESLIEYYEIHFYKGNNGKQLANRTLFKVEFKTHDELTGTLIKVASGSYITTLSGKKIPLVTSMNLEFAKLGECERDITPPNVQLIYPRATKDLLPLDAYFVFDINDKGKGVNTGNVTISFAGKIYASGSDYIARSGTKLIFSPADRLPIDKKLDLQIIAPDLQDYAGPNITNKTFSFRSAPGVLLMKYIDPIKFRELVDKTNENQGGKIRCDIARAVYFDADDAFRQKITGLLDRDGTWLGCRVPTDAEVVQYQKIKSLTVDTSITQKDSLSKLDILGIVLVCIIVLLLIYYIILYNNRKNRNKALIEFLSKMLAFIVLLLPSFGSATQIMIHPDYEDPQVFKSNIFHAGCNNIFQVSLDSVADVKKVQLILEYNHDDIEIVRFLPNMDDPKSVFEHKIESDTIKFYGTNKKNILKDKNLYRIEFKSDPAIDSTIIKVASGSYIITTGDKKVSIEKTINLDFAKVEECQPDITPPTLTLVSPQDVSSGLPLDTYFVFDVKDKGKGVDTGNVTISFAGHTYDSSTDYIIRSGTNLLFLPADWLPAKRRLDLKIIVQDLQDYNGPNKTEGIFSFTSASGILLTTYMSPSRLRELLDKTDPSVALGKARCDLVGEIYLQGNDAYRARVKELEDKEGKVLGCKNPSDQEVAEYKKNFPPVAKDPISSNRYPFLYTPLFSILIRSLFVLLLPLLLYSIIQYRKQKEKYNQYKHALCGDKKDKVS